MSEQKVWFITGVSTGLGRALAQVVAQHGDIAVGTLRKKDQISEFEELVPNKTFGVLLDVTDSHAITPVVEGIIEKHGRIDILVNNAGYGVLGSIEEIPDEDMMRQFDVNVFAPVRLIKAVLPYMRKQRSGHIMNITSIAGYQGYPGIGIYNGSKFALEGIGEALAGDVSPAGIHVTNVAPGPFKTDWAGRSATYVSSKIDDYADSAAKNLGAVQQRNGSQPGDPVKAGEAMFQISRMEEPPMHLPLGAAAYKRVETKMQSWNEELEKYRDIGFPTDFDQ